MVGLVLGVMLMVVGLAAFGTYVLAFVARPHVRHWSLSLLIAGAAAIVLGLWLTNQKW